MKKILTISACALVLAALSSTASAGPARGGGGYMFQDDYPVPPVQEEDYPVPPVQGYSSQEDYPVPPSQGTTSGGSSNQSNDVVPDSTPSDSVAAPVDKKVYSLDEVAEKVTEDSDNTVSYTFQ